MAKTFRPWDVEQRWLLPPSVQEMVPAGHLSHFVRETVQHELDLSEILAAYDEERGYPPYHPVAQVIVAHEVLTSPADTPQLVPMVERIKRNLGRHPKELSADTGYSPETNLPALPLPAIPALT